MSDVVKKRRKNPLRRRLSKVLTSALCGACLEECSQPHSQLLLCKYIVNLPWLLQCTKKALKVHTANHLQHVFNGAGGARAAIAAASNVHSSLGESNLIA